MENSQEQTEAKLLAYIEGELDEAGRLEIEQHIKANPKHRKLLDDLTVGRRAVRQLVREPAPPELFEAVQAQLERDLLLQDAPATILAGDEAGAINPETGNFRLQRRTRWARLRVAVAAAIVAGGIGVVVYNALPPRDQNVAYTPKTPTSGPAERPDSYSSRTVLQGGRDESLGVNRNASLPKTPSAGPSTSILSPTPSDGRGPEGGQAQGGEKRLPLQTNEPANLSATLGDPEERKLAESRDSKMALAAAAARDIPAVRNAVQARRFSAAAAPTGADRKGGVEKQMDGTSGHEPMFLVVASSDPADARRQVIEALRERQLAYQMVSQSGGLAKRSPDPLVDREREEAANRFREQLTGRDKDRGREAGASTTPADAGQKPESPIASTFEKGSAKAAATAGHRGAPAAAATPAPAEMPPPGAPAPGGASTTPAPAAPAPAVPPQAPAAVAADVPPAATPNAPAAPAMRRPESPAPTAAPGISDPSAPASGTPAGPVPHVPPPAPAPTAIAPEAPSAPAAATPPLPASAAKPITTYPAMPPQTDAPARLATNQPDAGGARSPIDEVLIVRRVPRSQAQKLVQALNRPQNAQYAAAYSDRVVDKLDENSKLYAHDAAAAKPGAAFGGGSGAGGGTGLGGGAAGRLSGHTQPMGNVTLRKADEPESRNGAPVGGSAETGRAMRPAPPGGVSPSTSPALATDPQARLNALIGRGETLQLIDARMRRNGQPVVVKLKVSDQGTIVVAGLGDVPVAGLTLKEANERLASGIKDKAPESAGAQLRRLTEEETLGDEDSVDVVIVLHQSPEQPTPATRPATEPAVVPATQP